MKPGDYTAEAIKPRPREWCDECDDYPLFCDHEDES